MTSEGARELQKGGSRVVHRVDVDVRQVNVVKDDSASIAYRLVTDEVVDARCDVAKLVLELRILLDHVGIQQRDAPRTDEVRYVHSRAEVVRQPSPQILTRRRISSLSGGQQSVREERLSPV